eukprot:3791124-Amphidinium_carterae.2
MAELTLQYIGKYLYLKATVFDGLYSYVDYTKNFTTESQVTSWYYTVGTTTTSTGTCMVYVMDYFKTLDNRYGDNITGNQSQKKLTKLKPRTLETLTKRNRRTQPCAPTMQRLV